MSEAFLDVSISNHEVLVSPFENGVNPDVKPSHRLHIELDLFQLL